jgi:hypothetical protein
MGALIYAGRKWILCLYSCNFLDFLEAFMLDVIGDVCCWEVYNRDNYVGLLREL